MTKGIRVVIGVVAACGLCYAAGVDILTEPRFPTTAHGKYPLATVFESAEGKAIRKAIPYQEPGFVRPLTAKYECFRTLAFPLPETSHDEVRYFTGISHLHGVIPQGANEVGTNKIGTAYLHKFVYEKGRVKNVYGVPKQGPLELENCVEYDDAGRLVIRGSFHNQQLGETLICAYAPGSEPLDVRKDPLRILRFGGRLQYTEGSVFVATPKPLTVEPGKLPCQALRYSIALRDVLGDTTVSDDHKVVTTLRFMQLRPVENEEESSIDASYASIRWQAISALGDLRGKQAFDALVRLLAEENSRAEAARALGKRADPAALPYLVDALEKEDRREKEGGHRRNAHLLSCALVAAMFDVSGPSAVAAVDKFLEAGNRTFAADIVRIRDRKRTTPPAVPSPAPGAGEVR